MSDFTLNFTSTETTLQIYLSRDCIHTWIIRISVDSAPSHVENFLCLSYSVYYGHFRYPTVILFLSSLVCCYPSSFDPGSEQNSHVNNSAFGSRMSPWIFSMITCGAQEGWKHREMLRRLRRVKESKMWAVTVGRYVCDGTGTMVQALVRELGMCVALQRREQLIQFKICAAFLTKIAWRQNGGCDTFSELWGDRLHGNKLSGVNMLEALGLIARIEVLPHGCRHLPLKCCPTQ